MRLTRPEESKLLTHAMIAVGLCLLLAGGTFYVVSKQRLVLETEAVAILSSNEVLLEGNRKTAKEIRFLRENAQTIEAMWSTLKGWGDGVKRGNITPLEDAGLSQITAIGVTKTPGNTTDYAGLKVSGDKTEFQRLLNAVSEVESNQGLLQIRAATMTLPGNAIPNGEKPTFLNIQLEIVAPSGAAKTK